MEWGEFRRVHEWNRRRVTMGSLIHYTQQDKLTSLEVGNT